MRNRWCGVWSVWVVSVLVLMSVSAVAQDATVVPDRSAEVTIRDDGMIFSFRLQGGYLFGEANELVYDYGDKLSQLIWEIDSMYMVGGGFTVKPCKWFSVQGDIWTKTSDGEGTMDDYDWFITGADWTHWSHHDDTDVTKGTILDVNAAVFPIRELDRHNITLSGLLGYRMENYEWEARGGTYSYFGTTGDFSDPADPNYIGDDTLGITYEQVFHVPYIGVNAAYTWGPVDIGLRLIGSTFVFGEADDQHHLRDMETHADFDGGDMFSVSLSLAYHLGEHVVLAGAIDYTMYDTMVADSTYTWTYEDGSTYEKTFDDTEGADLETTMASLSLALAF